MVAINTRSPENRMPIHQDVKIQARCVGPNHQNQKAQVELIVKVNHVAGLLIQIQLFSGKAFSLSYSVMSF